MMMQTPVAHRNLSAADVEYLRDLARRVAEIGNDPVQESRGDMWRRHNDLKRVRPMVLAFPEGSWRELLPGTELRIEDGSWRAVERGLLTRIYMWEHMCDDNVIEPVITTPIVTHTTGWGIQTRETRPDESTGAFHIDPVITEESDLDALRIPRLTVDWDQTRRREEELTEVFGGILRIERQGRFRGGYAPLDFYAKLRGIDNLYMDLIDRPEMVHRAIAHFTDGEIRIMKDAEEQGALTLGNRSHYAGSGGTSYTSQLPGAGFDGVHVRTGDLWGFATAQIFSEVSPAMHEEFALQHEKRYLSLFGLNCYGCCEPLHRKLNSLIEHIPNLRRVSISPWADVDASSEILTDRYVFSWKPNPAELAAETWQPEQVRAGLRSFCERTRGNIVEIVMKDTHTVRHQPQRFHDWVRIAREVAEEFA